MTTFQKSFTRKSRPVLGLITAAVIGTVLVGSSPSYAQSLKIGYVDMNRALNETDDVAKCKN